jgi:hypothetical protein
MALACGNTGDGEADAARSAGNQRVSFVQSDPV